MIYLKALLQTVLSLSLVLGIVYVTSVVIDKYMNFIFPVMMIIFAIAVVVSIYIGFLKDLKDKELK